MAVMQATSTTRSSQEHVYRPLAGSEIRVLHLKPGGFHDPIQLTLHHASLDEEPYGPLDYKALSYVWGPSDNNMAICVDSAVEFPVTDNLYDALRRLRALDTESNLWIDAISINQSDLAEKAAQVSLMGKIFGRALQVVVWLGEPPSTVSEVSAGECLREVINNASNRWWERVWTLQEYLLARNVTFFFGECQLEEAAFDRITQPSLIFHDGRYSWAESLDLPHPVRDALYWRAKFRSGLATVDSRGQRGGKQTLFDLCEIRMCTSATRIEDYVYALLGLLEPAYQNHISIDYEQNVESTFMQSTFAAIDISQSFEILALIPFKSAGDLKAFQLPSWVVPFHVLHEDDSGIYYKGPSGDNVARIGNIMRKIMCGSGRSDRGAFECVVIYTNAALMVSAYFCDSIEFSLPVKSFRSAKDARASVSRGIERWAASLSATWKTPDDDYSPDKVLHGFRLALADLIGRPRDRETPTSRSGPTSRARMILRAIESILMDPDDKSFSRRATWSRSIKYRIGPESEIECSVSDTDSFGSDVDQGEIEDPDWTSSIYYWLTYLDRISGELTLFITRRKIVGFGNSSVKVGDSLAILPSMRVPAVLRPRDSVAQSELRSDQHKPEKEQDLMDPGAESYTFHGFAFVHSPEGMRWDGINLDETRREYNQHTYRQIALY